MILIDPARMLLKQLGHKAENAAYVHVLRTISATIESARQQTEGSSLKGTEWYHEVLSKEAQLTENLLGSAFVVCQAYINSICTRAMRIGEYLLKKKAPSPFTNQKTIRGLGEPLYPGCPYSKVEVVSAFANYYKHHDEWPWDWTTVKSGSAKDTIAVMLAVGAKRGSPRNLRDGLRLLGAAEHHEVPLLESAIQPWVHALYEQAYAALQEFLLPEPL